LFWSVASVGATRNGQKEFYPAFLQDSNFLEKDIKDFLEKRNWDRRSAFTSHEQPRSMSEVAENDQLPF
jgi:hypothetical protein